MLHNTIDLLPPEKILLPDSASTLASIHWAQHWIFCAYLNDPVNAEVVARKFHLYQWVDRTKRRAKKFFHHEKQQWQCYKYQKSTRNNHIPAWLAVHLPDSDEGYIKDRFEYLLDSNCATMTYLDPWKALEEAALACPNFITNICKEMN